MAQRASADRGPGNGARSGSFVRATRNAGNTWHWWEVMAHGNLVDRPSGTGPTRGVRLWMLAWARVAGPRAQRGRRRPEALGGSRSTAGRSIGPRPSGSTPHGRTAMNIRSDFACLAPHPLVAGF